MSSRFLIFFLTSPHQISDREHIVELLGHGVVLHGHEEGVEDDADGDGQVYERIHYHHVDQLFHFQPHRAAVPDQEAVGKFVPAGGALLSWLFQLCAKETKAEDVITDVIMLHYKIIRFIISVIICVCMCVCISYPPWCLWEYWLHSELFSSLQHHPGNQKLGVTLTSSFEPQTLWLCPKEREN